MKNCKQWKQSNCTKCIKVAKLTQLAHMNKIHQQAKLGQMVLAIKQGKTVKRKKTGQTSWVGLFATELRSCELCPIKKVFLKCMTLAVHGWS